MRKVTAQSSSEKNDVSNSTHDFFVGHYFQCFLVVLGGSLNEFLSGPVALVRFQNYLYQIMGK